LLLFLEKEEDGQSLCISGWFDRLKVVYFWIVSLWLGCIKWDESVVSVCMFGLSFFRVFGSYYAEWLQDWPVFRFPVVVFSVLRPVVDAMGIERGLGRSELWFQ
jgi:hypothetical protein